MQASDSFRISVSLADRLVAETDTALMASYRRLAAPARRLARILLAVLPVMLVLVGSCKTSDLPGSYGSDAGPAQFRTALFPDRVNFKGTGYYPAAGYVSRARTFVTGSPQSLSWLTKTEIGYLFGKPAMERHDASASIWQYKGKACVVDVYFYGRDVGYVDYRHTDTAAPVRNKSACLDQIAG